MAIADTLTETRDGLDGIKLFEGLDQETLRELEKRCRWHRYSADEMILDQSESSNHDVYFVVQGVVRIVNYSDSGREIAFANIRAGAYFGELAAVADEPRSASVVAVEDCRLASLVAEGFRRVLLEHPEIAMHVIVQLSHVVRRCDERIMDLSTLGAIQRVHAELLRIAKPDIAVPKNKVVRPMPTHSKIASQVSTTRETVARALKQLSVAGIVERKGKTMYIRDFERLTEVVRSGATYQTLATR